MAISNSFDFSINRNQVIAGALRKLGVISQGQTPDSDQITDASEALNTLVKAWQAEGLPLWAIKTFSFTPVSGTTSYSVGTGLTVNTAEPLKIYQMYYRNNTSEIDIPINPLTQQQYHFLSSKLQEGTPVQFYYERLNGYGNIHLFLTPDTTFASNNTIYFLYQRPFSDFDSSTDTPDFPQEWIRALIYGLADEMSLDYGIPEKTQDRLKSRAAEYKEEALGFTQEEGSIFFSPTLNYYNSR